LSDVLKRIVAAKHAEILAARRRVAPAEMERRARAAAPARDFVGALRAKLAAGQAAVIAEIKRASPSRGVHPAGLCAGLLSAASSSLRWQSAST